MSDTSPKKTITVVSTAAALVASAASVQGVGRAFKRPPDDHPIYSLVGRVSSEWAHLEHTLDQIIWNLAGLDAPRGACITAQFMSIWPRYDTIKALLLYRAEHEPTFTEFVSVLNTLSGKTRKPSEDRNRIIHDPWYADAGDGQTTQLRSMPRSDPIYGLLNRDRDEILATIASIGRLSQRAQKLRNRIEAAVRASP